MTSERLSILPSAIRDRRRLSTTSTLDTIPDADTLAVMLRDDLRDAGLYVRVGVWQPDASLYGNYLVPPAFGGVHIYASDAKDSQPIASILLCTAIVIVVTRADNVTTRIPYAGRGWLAATKAALVAEHVVDALATIKPAGV